METQSIPRPFKFERDRLAFANQLLWHYTPEPEIGQARGQARGPMRFSRRVPAPDYAHRCFVMVRAARLFLHHAQWIPCGARLTGDEYLRRVRQVLSRNPRKTSPTSKLIDFPGYDGLFSFSRDHETLLKKECGGAWRSYVLRSHWRMVLPLSPAHQQWTSGWLHDQVQRGGSPLVHLVSFPALTINHGMVVFESKKTVQGMEYQAYDPNDAIQPARLEYDDARRSFYLPANAYWAGGELKVIGIFRNWWI